MNIPSYAMIGRASKYGSSGGRRHRLGIPSTPVVAVIDSARLATANGPHPDPTGHPSPNAGRGHKNSRALHPNTPPLPRLGEGAGGEGQSRPGTTKRPSPPQWRGGRG